MDLQGLHVKFWFHKNRDSNIRVFVSQIPIGVPDVDIKLALALYGDIAEIRKISKVHRGHRYDTRERIVVFKKLIISIPSYLRIRGYMGYIKYPGQPATCRICGLIGHLAAACPGNTKNKGKAQDKTSNWGKDGPKASGNLDTESEVVNMDVHEQPPPNEPDPKNPGNPESCEDTLEKLVTIEDCQIPSSLETETQQEAQNPDGQSQAWADPLKKTLFLLALRSLKKTHLLN